jgi:hypothetical protein
MGDTEQSAPSTASLCGKLSWATDGEQEGSNTHTTPPYTHIRARACHGLPLRAWPISHTRHHSILEGVGVGGPALFSSFAPRNRKKPGPLRADDGAFFFLGIRAGAPTLAPPRRSPQGRTLRKSRLKRGCVWCEWVAGKRTRLQNRYVTITALALLWAAGYSGSPSPALAASRFFPYPL